MKIIKNILNVKLNLSIKFKITELLFDFLGLEIERFFSINRIRIILKPKKKERKLNKINV